MFMRALGAGSGCNRGLPLDCRFRSVPTLEVNSRQQREISAEFGLCIWSKLVSGFPDDTFRAQQPANRAQAAAMVWRAYQFGNNNKLEQKVERVKVEFPVQKVPVYVEELEEAPVVEEEAPVDETEAPADPEAPVEATPENVDQTPSGQ